MKGPLSLLALAALAAPLAATPAALLQPQSGARSLQLEITESRSWLRRPNGQKLRLPLRRGERVEELVEFDNGWAATSSRMVGGRGEVAVVVDGAGGIERLRPIPEPIGDLRVRPIPMASADGFRGLAWLEGDAPAGYQVRVSEWTGALWTPPATVSPALPGGQAGLAGTVLEDGRWLLVWSGSRGASSELLWSVRDHGRWTPPRAMSVPNQVPDVTPSLVRVAGGALLVWARRGDSGYGLQTARFASSWSAPRRLGGDRAWSPRFADLGEAGRFLTYRSADGWTALELDAGGRELRRAEIAGDQQMRPVLTSMGGGIAIRSERGAPTRPLRWEGTP